MTRLYRAAPPPVAGNVTDLPAGLCAADPDAWLARNGRPTRIHQCRHHCPILAYCRANIPVDPPPRGVIAGVAYAGGVPAETQRAAASCDLCRGMP